MPIATVNPTTGETEKVFDCSEHSRRRVVRVIDNPTFDLRADDERFRALVADMIGPRLCVILDHEHNGVLPIRAVAERVDHPAEREIVVGDHRVRRVHSGPRRRSVVVG